MYNELTGYYRSVGRTREAIESGEQADKLIAELDLTGTEFHATTLVNTATAYRAGEHYERALELYQRAEKIYKKVSNYPDIKRAGLYNNMSMAYQGKNQCDKAITYLYKALEIIKALPEYRVETASTYTNLSAVYFELEEYEKGITALQEALKLYEEEETKDSHYSALLASLAHGYYLKKDYGQSVAYYTNALKEILEHYGECENYAITCENCAIVLEESGYGKQAQYLRQKAWAARVKQKKGMEISRMYYEMFGEKMLKEKFPKYFDKITVGLMGHGSECFGFDDTFSRDHDFGPAFCIWLEEEDYKK